MTTVGVLLAAGRSSRFGADDKLLAPCRGAPLVSHAAAALRASELAALVAVVSDDAVAVLLDGFTLATIPGTKAGQSHSLRAGVGAAMKFAPDRILVTLGDMPFVTPDLIRRVRAACGDNCPSTATDGRRRMPPSCFPRASFRDLLGSTGDRGARHILSKLPPRACVTASPDALRDIDRPEDLDPC